jgi:iron complex outermembrane receptor protein
MAGVESRLDLGSTAALDLRLRYVDDLPARSLDAYTTLDARLAWRPRTQIELALVGQNLLSPRHAEFPAGGGETIQVRRGAYAEVTWRP